MRKFISQGCVAYVLHIGDQWFNKARKTREKWRIIRSAEYTTYPDFAEFPGPIQSFFVNQLKLAKQTNADTETLLTKELNDDMICPVDCMFYRQYQLPYKHIWQYHLIYNVFILYDWDR